MLHTILTDSYVHLQQQLQVCLLGVLIVDCSLPSLCIQWTNQQIMQFVETMKVC